MINLATFTPKAIRTSLFAVGVTGLALTVALLMGSAAPQGANAAACQPPGGAAQLTTSVTIPKSGVYKVWSRIKAPNSATNSYMLEVDGKTCFVVGDRSISTNTWTWVDYINGLQASKSIVSLTAGEHTLKMYGREAGIQVDRAIFALDQACVPAGMGDNCIPQVVQPNGKVAVPFRMNVGGDKYTDRFGAAWAQDMFFVGGQTNNQGAGKTIAGSGGDNALYQSERWGMSGYSIPVANGTYLLALHFAELYPPCNNKVGCRVFSVSVEGSKFLNDFDIVKAAGASYKANIQLVTARVNDGKLDIGFQTKVNASALTALQILPAGTPSPTVSVGPEYARFDSLLTAQTPEAKWRD